jgi:hypothetical protein
LVVDVSFGEDCRDGSGSVRPADGLRTGLGGKNCNESFS